MLNALSKSLILKVKAFSLKVCFSLRNPRCLPKSCLSSEYLGQQNAKVLPGKIACNWRGFTKKNFISKSCIGFCGGIIKRKILVGTV